MRPRTPSPFSSVPLPSIFFLHILLTLCPYTLFLMSTLTWVKSKFAEVTEAFRAAHPELAVASADWLEVLQYTFSFSAANSPVNSPRTVSPFRRNGPRLLVSQQGRPRTCQRLSPRQSATKHPQHTQHTQPKVDLRRTEGAWRFLESGQFQQS